MPLLLIHRSSIGRNPQCAHHGGGGGEHLRKQAAGTDDLAPRQGQEPAGDQHLGQTLVLRVVLNDDLPWRWEDPAVGQVHRDRAERLPVISVDEQRRGDAVRVERPVDPGVPERLTPRCLELGDDLDQHWFHQWFLSLSVAVADAAMTAARRSDAVMSGSMCCSNAWDWFSTA